MAAARALLAIALTLCLFSSCLGKDESSTRVDSFAQALAASEEGMAQQRQQQGFARVAVGRAVTGGWQKARQAAAHRKNFASLAQANYAPKKATDQFGRKMLSGAVSKAAPCHYNSPSSQRHHNLTVTLTA